MAASNLRKVGDVAKQFGISSQTLHWYEAQGLIPEAVRTESGYRQYSEQAIDQIAFVRKALALGLSVKDIKEILELRRSGQMPCEHVLELLGKRIAEITEQISSLEEMRAQLLSLQSKWKGKAPAKAAPGSSCCPIIEESELSGGTSVSIDREQ